MRTMQKGLLVGGCALVGAFGAIGSATAQEPAAALTPATPIEFRSVEQPIGTPRIRLDGSTVPRLTRQQMAAACAAPVDVNIQLSAPTTTAVPTTTEPSTTTPDGGPSASNGLNLKLRTEQKAVWYSLVDTIPPIGHTASVTVDPVNLLDGDRKVGTLVSGEVKFREVVRDVALTGTEAENQQTVRTLLANLETMPTQTLDALRPIALPEYSLPPAGIQVMRARLEETYEIDGVGTDTVELTGWIAVRHGTPRAVAGAAELNWETAVTDTEFVGMRLTGVSEKFGNVLVTLDTTRPSYGQVGRIEIPELAKYALVAKLKKERLAQAPAPVAAPATGASQQ
jgi:hypothetical protein